MAKILTRPVRRMSEAEKALAIMQWPSIQHLLYHMPYRSARDVNKWRVKQGLKPLHDRYKDDRSADAV